MNKFLPFLLLFFSFTLLQAQEENYRIEDAVVTAGDLNTNSYSKDSTANALYIYEEGYTRFREGNTLKLVTDFTAKVKILNKEGYEHADIKIRLSKNSQTKEKLNKLEAATYYIENGIIKQEILEASKVYTEENPDYDLVKFTFPALRPGAVIVYSYELESPFFYKFQTWWFQEDIPKIYSKFVSEIPGNFNYNIKKVGTHELAKHDAELVKNCFFKDAANPGSCVKTEYVMEHIPAFVEENYLTSRYNFLARIEYELIEVTALDGRVTKYTKTWKDVDKEIRTDGDLGRQLKKTSAVKNVLPEDIRNMPNNLEKAQKIYAFVKENYKWNGDYKIFGDMDIKDVLKEQSGNVSGINGLLHNIYKEQGYNVWPVLNSTRANGLPTKLYPVLSEFNYLTVQLEIEGEKYFLDATEKYLDFGNLPYRCLNSYARLLDFKDGSSWVDIEPKSFSMVAVRDSITVNSDGTSKGVSQHSFSGYHAIIAREKLDELTNAEIFNTLTTPNTHTRSRKAEYLLKNNTAEALDLTFDLDNASQKINDLIYVNPFSFAFFGENPFQLKERHYPIDFGYRDAYSYSVHLEIPEGHEVVDLPEQKLLRLPENGGSLNFVVQQVNENTVNIHCRVTFPRAVYVAGYYPYFKEFFNEMIDIQKQSLIVIRQKS